MIYIYIIKYDVIYIIFMFLGLCWIIGLVDIYVYYCILYVFLIVVNIYVDFLNNV